jgi:hypothetical protein
MELGAGAGCGIGRILASCIASVMSLADASLVKASNAFFMEGNSKVLLEWLVI